MTARRVRVMVLLDTLAAGGAERFAIELACSLAPSEFAPFVVATKRGGPLEQRLVESRVPYTVLGRRRLTSPRPALRALRLARRSDLVHSHLFGNNVWGSVLARVAGVPLVAHEHNRVGLHVRFESAFDRFLIGPTAARILCVSGSAARQLFEAGVSRSLVEVVPNGVRLDRSERAEARAALGLAEQDVVVGIVASLRPEKAHDVLLTAFASLVGGGAHPRLRLCMVGDGACRESLEALAARLGVEHRVTFAGERIDAPDLHAAFDVSVLASRSEGLPLAALESLAAGTPLVATRVGGLPELLEGGAGLLVDPGDDEELAAAIGAVLTDPELHRRLAETGRRRVSERHDLARTVGVVEAVYRDVLGRPFQKPQHGESDELVKGAAHLV